MNEVLNFLKTLPEHRLLIILEAFRVAVSDAEIYDNLVSAMDISDEEMFEIRDSVYEFLRSPNYD